MAVRTNRIASFTGAASGSLQAIYTVPSDRTALIKHVTMRHTFGGSPIFALSIRTGSLDLQAIREAHPNGTTRHWSGLFLVAEPGDVLLVQIAGGAPELQVGIFGALLAGGPE